MEESCKRCCRWWCVVDLTDGFPHGACAHAHVVVFMLFAWLCGIVGISCAFDACAYGDVGPGCFWYLPCVCARVAQSDIGAPKVALLAVAR